MRHLPSDPRHRQLQGYINRADIELSRLSYVIEALEAKRSMWRELRRSSLAVWDDLNDADEDLASALEDLELATLMAVPLPTASEASVPPVVQL